MRINYHAVKSECTEWTLGRCRDGRTCPWAHSTAEQIRAHALNLAGYEAIWSKELKEDYDDVAHFKSAQLHYD